MNYACKIPLRFCFVLTLVLPAAGRPLSAQGLDSHVHGNAQLNVALIGQQIQLEFISPAMNLLGIERAPSSDEELALFERVNQKLQSAEWLIGDAFRSCQSSTEVLESPEFAEAHEHDDSEHDDHSHDSETHMDFHVQYLFDCATSPANQFTVTAFADFSGIEEITVQWITEAQQGLAQLTANNPSLILE